MLAPTPLDGGPTTSQDGLAILTGDTPPALGYCVHRIVPKHVPWSRSLTHCGPFLSQAYNPAPCQPENSDEVWVIPEGDRTGENAIECEVIALPCADCGESAGCEEHAVCCPRCGKPICDYCADEYRCVAKTVAKAKRARAA